MNHKPVQLSTAPKFSYTVDYPSGKPHHDYLALRQYSQPLHQEIPSKTLGTMHSRLPGMLDHLMVLLPFSRCFPAVTIKTTPHHSTLHKNAGFQPDALLPVAAASCTYLPMAFVNGHLSLFYLSKTSQRSQHRHPSALNKQSTHPPAHYLSFINIGIEPKKLEQHTYVHGVSKKW